MYQRIFLIEHGIIMNFGVSNILAMKECYCEFKIEYYVLKKEAILYPDVNFYSKKYVTPLIKSRTLIIYSLLLF